MTEIILWVFLALVQREGAVGAGFGSQEACQEARLDALKLKDVLAISDCNPIKVTKKESA